MRLLMFADTHVPKRARDLPAELWAEVGRADVVIHAGDWVEDSLLDVLLSRSARLIGVYGNNDGAALRGRLPEVARAEPQSHPLGHHRGHRTAVAQPGLTDRSAASAPLHVHVGDRRGGTARRRHLAPAAAAGVSAGDPILIDEPTENIDANDPMLAQEAKEPTLPTERADPRDAMDSRESSDHSDQRLLPVRDAISLALSRLFVSMRL